MLTSTVSCKLIRLIIIIIELYVFQLLCRWLLLHFLDWVAILMKTASYPCGRGIQIFVGCVLFVIRRAYVSNRNVSSGGLFGCSRDWSKLLTELTFLVETHELILWWACSLSICADDIFCSRVSTFLECTLSWKFWCSEHPLRRVGHFLRASALTLLFSLGEKLFFVSSLTLIGLSVVA